jgi:hypothetical protein
LPRSARRTSLAEPWHPCHTHMSANT